MYDEIYRIPLIVSHPACENPGTTCDEFAYLHEIMPTILDAAGCEGPDDLDGQSLLPAALGQEYANGREEIYAVFERHFTVVNQRMVRTRTHQFTFNSGDQGELYDLVKDPCQLENVYGRPEYEDVRRDLMERMDRHMRELGDPLGGWFRRIKGAY